MSSPLSSRKGIFSVSRKVLETPDLQVVISKRKLCREQKTLYKLGFRTLTKANELKIS